jgi:hypothetical protein
LKPKTQISKDISIEDLVEYYPFAVHYLSQKGILCVVCGDPIWLTLEEAAIEKGFNENAIKEVVNELRMLAIDAGNQRKNFEDKKPKCHETLIKKRPTTNHE